MATVPDRPETTGLEAPQVPIPTTPAQVPGPFPGNTMPAAYVQLVGRMAYLWGFPMVNLHNRRIFFSKTPKPVLLGGVLPLAPVGYNAMLTDFIDPHVEFVVEPNQDTVYGGGFAALDKEPVVVQVPDFGDRYYVFGLYDQRTDEVARLGKQFGTAPGFYMFAGANWNGKVPAGISAVFRSSTGLMFIIPRVFVDSTPEDKAAVQPLLSQIMMYPLSEFDGEMKTTDWAKLPPFPVPKENAPGGESKWVNPASYYDELPLVMKEVPPLPGEEALYAWISSVWAAAAKDPATKQTLVESFAAADVDLVEVLFNLKYNGRDVGNGWTSVGNSALWGTDYLNRTAVAKSSIFMLTPEEALYHLKVADSHGQELDGNHLYTVTFPHGELPPVKGFWSMTVYNAEHFFHQNKLNQFSVGTKNDDLQIGADGSLTLYMGASSPGANKEPNWLPAPQGTFTLILRNYWPDQAIIDGTWVPPDAVKVQ